MKQNKKAGIALQLLVLLIAIVFTSAITLLLIQSGMLTVRADADKQLLNTEFVPMDRSGTMVIKEFQFCRYVNEQYFCLEPQEEFNTGEEVHFRFAVESSTYNGEIAIVENYRLKDPTGKILLDVGQRNNFNFEMQSRQLREQISFKDFFIVNSGSPEGEYTLELILENPLLNKKTTLTKTFTERREG